MNGELTGNLLLASKKHLHWLVISGVILIALGVAAILLPQTATLAIELLIGGVLLLSGLLNLMHAVQVRHRENYRWQLFSALAALVAGILLLAFPVAGSAGLTLLLAIYFLVVGTQKTLSAFQWRVLRGWGWLLFSGLLDVVLGLTILFLLPAVATWLLGLFLGVSLIFNGWWLLVIALAARHADK